METRSKKRLYSQIGSTRLFENPLGTVGDVFLPPQGGTLQGELKTNTASVEDNLVGISLAQQLEQIQGVYASSKKIRAEEKSIVGNLSDNYVSTNATIKPYATRYDTNDTGSLITRHWHCGPTKESNGTKFNLLGLKYNTIDDENYTGGKIEWDEATGKLNVVKGSGGGVQVNGVDLGVPAGDIVATSITCTTHPGGDITLNDNILMSTGTALKTNSLLCQTGGRVTCGDDFAVNTGKGLITNSITSQSGQDLSITSSTGKNITIDAPSTGVININNLEGNGIRFNCNSSASTTPVIFTPDGDTTKSCAILGVFNTGTNRRPFIAGQKPGLAWDTLYINPDSGTRTIIGASFQDTNFTNPIHLGLDTNIATTLSINNSKVIGGGTEPGIDSNKQIWAYNIHLNTNGNSNTLGQNTTAPRSWTLPDNTGTIALLSDIGGSVFDRVVTWLIGWTGSAWTKTAVYEVGTAITGEVISNPGGVGGVAKFVLDSSTRPNAIPICATYSGGGIYGFISCEPQTGTGTFQVVLRNASGVGVYESFILTMQAW